MSMLFLVCGMVCYTDGYLNYGDSEGTVIVDVFEADNRKAADLIYRERKLNTLRSSVIKNRLLRVGYNVQYEQKPRLEVSLYAIRASYQLCLHYPKIVVALKSYLEDLKDSNKLKKRLATATLNIENSKTWKQLYS